MSATVSIDRTSLDLPALVIAGEPPVGGGFFLTVGGVAEPSFDVRATYAPTSAYVGGTQLLAAVLEASTLPLVIGAKANTPEALGVLKAELAAAAFQFAYPLTLTVGGVAQTWRAGPAWPVWGDLDSAWVGVNIARAALSIPVNP